MKNIAVTLILFLIAALSCTNDNSIVKSGTTKLIPHVLWKVGGAQVSPDEVDSVRLTVTSPDLSSSRSSTFGYADHEGVIENLPTGISLTLTIEGLGGNGDVIYSGTVSISNLSGAEFSVVIDASQVSPRPPDSLKVTAKSYKTMQITWQDFSSNETKFVIERKNIAGAYDSLGIVAENVTSYLDTGLTASTVYTYRVRAANLAGSSAATLPASDTTLSVNANSTPYFDITAVDLSDTLVVGERYARKLTATDEDGDSLTFSAISTLTLSVADSISWIPAIADTGLNSFWVKVADDSGAVDSIGFGVFVWDTTTVDTSDTTTPPDTSTTGINLDSGLVAWYPFNGNANDASGNGNNGVPTDINYSTDRFGTSTSAAEFNSTSSYIEVPNSADIDLGGSSFTLAVWTKLLGPPTIPYNLLDKHGPAENAGFMLHTAAVSLPERGLASGWSRLVHAYDNKLWYYDVAKSIVDGSWHHVVARNENDSLSIYVDGIKCVGSYWENGTPFTINDPTSMYIGKFHGSTTNSLNGLIDDIRIYNRALDSAEIDSLYREGGWPITATDIDGNVYSTVTIGTQVWTVQNLRTTRYNNGDSIPHITDSAAWAGSTTPAYCFYDNATDAASKEKWGALYNWHAVDTGNLAPAGWHVPSDAEWTTLENYLIANGYNYDGTTSGNKVAKSMAAKTDWTTDVAAGAVGNDISANNSSGFSGSPAGYRLSDGNFSSQDTTGYWWSGTANTALASWTRYLRSDLTSLGKNDSHKRCGFTVRLVRD